MQRPDERKRRLIATIAARMFAEHPFHKVRLDDIAAEAGVGKGTLYVYFDGKEDLYLSIICEGFVQLIDRLRETKADGSPRRRLRRIIGELVAFGFQHPPLFELMRRMGLPKGRSEAEWDEKRRELVSLIEATIRQGVAAGEMRDAHPELTALCIPGLVRSVMLFGPKGLDERAVTHYIVRLLERGLACKVALAAGKGD